MNIPVFDEQTETYGSITTEGAVIKPWLKVLKNVVDEARFEVDDNGIHVQAVDPANVIMIQTTLKANAFASYDVDGFVEGFNLGRLVHNVRRARVNSDDTLHMEFGNNEVRTQVSRGYENVDVVSSDSLQTIDPDSIREKPDIPDLELPYDVDIDTDALVDAVDHALPQDNAFVVDATDGNLTFSGDGVVVMDGINHDCDEVTHYSRDYIKTILKSIQKVNPESVNLEWGDDFPLFVRFESEYAEYMLMLAPRIKH